MKRLFAAVLIAPILAIAQDSKNLEDQYAAAMKAQGVRTCAPALATVAASMEMAGQFIVRASPDDPDDHPGTLIIHDDMNPGNALFTASVAKTSKAGGCEITFTAVISTPVFTCEDVRKANFINWKSGPKLDALTVWTDDKPDDGEFGATMLLLPMGNGCTAHYGGSITFTAQRMKKEFGQ